MFARANVSGTVNAAPTEISQTSSYTFELDIQTPIPEGGTIVAMMPPGFDLPAGLQLPCDPIYGFERTSASCSVNDDGNIEFRDAFPTVDFLIIFSVELQNPSYASTFFLRVFTYDASPNG